MYSSWSIPTLRQAARERGLDSRGGKKQLQKRLECALEREVQQQRQQQQQQQQQQQPLQQQLPAPIPISNPVSIHHELLITATPAPNPPVTLVTSSATPTPTPDFIHITTNDADVGQSIPTPASPVLTSRMTAMIQHVPPSLEGKIRVTISLDGTAKQSFVLLTTSSAPAQCKHNYTLLLATASNKFRCKVKRLFVASTGEELLASNLHTVFSAILAQGAAACKAVVTTGQTYVAPSAGSDSPDISKSVMTAAQASLVEGKIDADGWPNSSIVQQLITENGTSTSYSSPPLSPTANATNLLSPTSTMPDASATSTPLPTTCASSSDMSSANVYDVLSTLQRQSTSSPVAHHRILYSDATSPSTSPTLPSTPTTMSRHHSFTDFSLVNHSQSVYTMLTTPMNSTTTSTSTTSSDTTSTSTSTQSQRDMELLEKRCKRLEAEAKQAARTEKKLTEEVTKLTQLLAAARVFEDKYKECSSSLAKSEQLIAKMTREKERLTYKNKTLATQNMTLKEQAAQHETTSQQQNKLQAQLDALTGADERHAVPKTASELQYLLQIHSTGLARVHQQMSISLEQERRALRERKTCKICMDGPLECLLLPCSHYVCCERCSNKITACPICRRHIEERKPVYM